MSTIVDRDFVILVSAPSRSGTSLLMRMLQFGGVSLHYDKEVSKANDFNIYGYFEVSRTPKNMWELKGKAIKIPLVAGLEGDVDYRVIYIDRDDNQILRSRRERHMKVLSGMGKLNPYSPRVLGDLKQAKAMTLAYMTKRKNFDFIVIKYDDIFRDTLECANRIKEFIGEPFDSVKACEAVDKLLYRRR